MVSLWHLLVMSTQIPLRKDNLATLNPLNPLRHLRSKTSSLRKEKDFWKRKTKSIPLVESKPTLYLPPWTKLLLSLHTNTWNKTILSWILKDTELKMVVWSVNSETLSPIQWAKFQAKSSNNQNTSLIHTIANTKWKLSLWRKTKPWKQKVHSDQILSAPKVSVQKSKFMAWTPKLQR